MITAPTFSSPISYKVILFIPTTQFYFLFLVGSKRQVHVESYQWQIGLEGILILPLAPCGFDTPYLSLSPLGIATMIPYTWGLSSSFLAPLPGSNSVGLIFSCVLVCSTYQILFFLFVSVQLWVKHTRKFKKNENTKKELLASHA